MIRIQDITFVKNEEWDNIWKDCEYATYGHSREFAETWSCYTGGIVYPEPRMVYFSDGQKALIPLSVRKFCKGLFKKRISSPTLCFGGWLSLTPLDKEHERLLTDYMLKDLGNLLWVTNPFQNISTLTEIAAKGKQYETYAIDLRPGFESIYKSWKKKTQKTRKARKEGVEIKIATQKAEWEEFFEIYQDSLRRWGESAGMVYEHRMIDILWERKSPYLRLYLAVYQGKIIAGGMVSYAKRHAEGAMLSSLREYHKLYPVNLVAEECIKDSCERGCYWFDFGSCVNFNTDTVYEGVRDFKKGFKAEEMPWYLVNIESPPLKTAVMLEKNLNRLLSSPRLRGLLGKK